MQYNVSVLALAGNASMAELVDASDLKSDGLTAVWVRFPLEAQVNQLTEINYGE